jgi:hypothetical protein
MYVNRNVATEFLSKGKAALDAGAMSSVKKPVKIDSALLRKLHDLRNVIFGVPQILHHSWNISLSAILVASFSDLTFLLHYATFLTHMVLGMFSLSPSTSQSCC